jgi:DNA mismatch endonuclease (patch repair protein)
MTNCVPSASACKSAKINSPMDDSLRMSARKVSPRQERTAIAFSQSTSEPFASSPRLRRRMQSQPRRDTQPEIALRRELHRLGLRYRLDQAPMKGLRRKADIVFRRARVAVYVDGCFWHGCPQHGNTPEANPWYWPTKIRTNKARDRDTNAALRRLGWRVIRVWEHEQPIIAARRIYKVVRDRAPGERKRSG